MGRFTGEAGRKGESQLSTKGLNVESSKETEALLLELGWQETEKLENLNQRVAEQQKKNRNLQSEIFAMIRELILVQSLDGKISQQVLEQVMIWEEARKKGREIARAKSERAGESQEQLRDSLRLLDQIYQQAGVVCPETPAPGEKK
jgi:predicted RNase H-like nuclease (RuvC/YqgF family)